MKEKNKAIGVALVFICGWSGVHNLYYREYKKFFLHLVGPGIMLLAYALADALYRYNMLSTSSSVAKGDPSYDGVAFLINLFWFGIAYTLVSHFVAIINFIIKKL